MKIRLGSINFLNSLPVDYALSQGIVLLPRQSCLNKPCLCSGNCSKVSEQQPVDEPLPEIEIIRDVPANLNRMLISGHLDVSPISSIEYARNEDKLLLLPDISISSDSGVNSVILVSKRPIEDLNGQTVYVTDKGATTPVLLKILLSYHYHIRVKIETIPQDSNQAGAESVLLIGDEALKIASQPDDGLFKTDLSVIWHQWTAQETSSSLPMVFAVWAVRKEFISQYPDVVRVLWQTLLESKRWGLSHLDVITSYARLISDLDQQVIKTYFQNLRYDFSLDYQHGLQRYYDYARKIGELHSEVTLRLIYTT